MPQISEITMLPNAHTLESLKHWITELTSYSPQQVDTVISKIEQEQTAQYNLFSRQP